MYDQELEVCKTLPEDFVQRLKMSKNDMISALQQMSNVFSNFFQQVMVHSFVILCQNQQNIDEMLK